MTTLDKESLVELLFRVQTGHCSCRAAADIILKLVEEDRQSNVDEALASEHLNRGM